MLNKFLAVIFGVILSANLLATVGFAAAPDSTASECDKLLYDSASDSYNIWKLQDKSFNDIAKCATPSAAKTQALSPLQILQIIIDAMNVLATLLAILGIVIGAIKMATSAGDKGKFESGKSLIVNSFIAIAITLTAYQLLSYATSLIGLNL